MRPTRLRYTTITDSAKRSSFRRTGAAGIILASLLIAACGGSGGDDCNTDNPTAEECGPNDGSDNDTGNGSGDDGSTGGDDNGSDDGSDGDSDGSDDNNDDSGGDSNVSEISLDELQAHLYDTPASDRPPKLAEWERNMQNDGSTMGQYLQSSASFSDRRKATYYDGQRVYMQISEYLGERQPWVDYAETSGDIYRQYVESNDGQVAGYWRFSHGFYLDYSINGDNSAGDFLVTMRDEPTFSDPTRGVADGWYQSIRAREVAYSLQGHIIAAKGGHGLDQEKVDRLVEMALGHVDIWTSEQYISSNDDWRYVQAFMAGLTASALIDYYEYTEDQGDADDRVEPAIRTLADWLWDEMWVAEAEGTSYGAFEYRQYDDGSSHGPSGDLNMLIVPMYGWLYKESGESRHLERGDDVFEGGVELAWLGGGKQFNQNYRDSFDFLRWRQEGLDRFGN